MHVNMCIPGLFQACMCSHVLAMSHQSDKKKQHVWRVAQIQRKDGENMGLIWHAGCIIAWEELEVQMLGTWVAQVYQQNIVPPIIGLAFKIPLLDINGYQQVYAQYTEISNGHPHYYYADHHFDAQDIHLRSQTPAGAAP